MLNCKARLHADPHSLARRMAELVGLETERLVLWLFARCVQESVEWPQLAEVPAGSRPHSRRAPQPDRLAGRAIGGRSIARLPPSPGANTTDPLTTTFSP